jgi:hypothetical protein
MDVPFEPNEDMIAAARAEAVAIYAESSGDTTALTAEEQAATDSHSRRIWQAMHKASKA